MINIFMDDGGVMEHYEIHGPDIISEEMDDETVVINLESGCYYSLNAAATKIWEAVLSKKAIKASGAFSDVITIMLDEKLIRKTDGTAQASGTYEPDMTGDITLPVIEKHSDIKEMLILDPIHEVEDLGWHNKKI
jgi:hypothetical protein